MMDFSEFPRDKWILGRVKLRMYLRSYVKAERNSSIYFFKRARSAIGIMTGFEQRSNKCIGFVCSGFGSGEGSRWRRLCEERLDLPHARNSQFQSLSQPMSFSSYFFCLSCWGGRVKEWLGRCLAASPGQPNTVGNQD